ncbi:MAG: hypothetical protein ABUK01_15425 [Leptospirales bacterium]
MIDTSEKLTSMIKLKYRFIKEAASQFGFPGAKNYQRFRNTILGASKDYQVILALVENIPKIDTAAIWGIDKKYIKNTSYKKEVDL